MANNPKYPIENSLRKLFLEIKELVIMMKKFFFRPIKDKEDLLIYVISVSPWLLFMVSFVYLAGR